MDSEKVIKEFADYYQNFKAHCIGDIEDHAMLKDALVLLKEQQQLIWELQEQVEYLTDKQKEQEAVEPFHKCIGNEFSLIEDSHFDYCPYCGKPVTWAKQEGR